MSLYAELNLGDELLDSDDISRYCRPNTYDRRRCEPRVSAFQRRRCESGPSQGMLLEDELSVNRIQFFQLRGRDRAIECTRQEFLSRPYTLVKNGRFVVFNVGKAKVSALEDGGYQLLILYTPDPPLLSHASIFNLPDDIDEERAVATAIKRLITKSGTYRARP